MKDEATLAYIHLFAVLANLQGLCDKDETSRALLPKKPVVLTFSIFKGPKLTLKFDANGCTQLTENQGCDIYLLFRSPAHFNQMMASKANPIIVKGFTKIGFLTKQFNALTQRLGYFLNPKPAQFDDPEFLRINTELTLFTAINAAVQIANHDKVISQTVKALDNGNIALNVKDGPAMTLTIHNSKLAVVSGLPDSFRAKMEFNGIDAAHRLLQGLTDSFSAIATEELTLSGFIPMLDGLDKLLFRANYYLK